MARLCNAGVQLRKQVDAKWPKRDRRSDGWIGDPAHAARVSDHNPDKHGIVHAIDIDENLGVGPLRNGRQARQLANQLRMYAASGLPGAERLKYIVYENRISSGTYRATWWKWRPGNWGHEYHIHVSFRSGAANNGDPFPLPCLATTKQVEAIWAKRLKAALDR